MEQLSLKAFLDRISSGNYLEGLLQEMDSILKELDFREKEFTNKFREAERLFRPEYYSKCRDPKCSCRILIQEFNQLEALYLKVQQEKRKWNALKIRVDEHITNVKRSEPKAEPDSTIPP